SAPATARQFADSRPVTITLTAGIDIPLMARRAGVVTTGPGGLTLESGKAAVWVDGSPVVGLATTTPLYRNLSVGDAGADAAALNQELARLGYPAPQSDVYTSQTGQAWQALQVALGSPAPVTAFDVDRVLWLPAATVQVSAWRVTAGVSVAPGDVFGVVPGQVMSAHVAMADGSPIPAGSRTVTVGGVSVPLPTDGTVTDGGFLGAAVAVATIVQTDGSQERLQTSGTTELAQPIAVLGVPPVAVFGLAGDHGCVQVGDSGVPVTVVGASLGTTLVRPDDGAGFDRVAIGTGITVTGC
ncbi:MAG: hypothetical protein FWC46_01150, partial [Actinomycetia bacterium]|nr:hypothetical protein [Actinomycetes bacterium]